MCKQDLPTPLRETAGSLWAKFALSHVLLFLVFFLPFAVQSKSVSFPAACGLIYSILA